ncbi:MAG: HlyD family efflux transporter periplasmic adaptor subunit [Methylococcaceae bacterium]|nr:MAG: HlyD family efflux transporter periplasmic adaptor subunit [Methylococcaceae bacterium]
MSEFRQHETTPASALRRLTELRRFDGPPPEFWSRLLDGLGRLVEAQGVLLLVQTPAGEWRRMAVWPVHDSPFNGAALIERSQQLAGQGNTADCLRDAIDADGQQSMLALRFPLPPGHPSSMAAVFFAQPADLDEAELRLRLIADIPEHYLMQRMLERTDGAAVYAVRVLDLLLQVNEARHFVEAAMLLCNEVAAQYQCERVALGWSKDRYIQLQAMSHMENFDRKMDAVQALEKVMEECLYQDQEILWSEAARSDAVVRDHAAYAQGHGLNALLSLPLRVRGEAVAVLSCESKQVFTLEHLRGLRILADQVTPRLQTLQHQDLWWTTQLAMLIKPRVIAWLKPEQTALKLATAVGAVVLAYMLFGRWDYRVEAPFIVRGEKMAFVSAPFDGYIDQIRLKVSDEVEAGTEVLSLQTDEMVQREAEAMAEVSRYEREAGKARAAGQLADMVIADALREQAQARLDELRQKLSRAWVKAPIRGVIAEGDFEKMPKAPVKRGDALFKVATLENLYFELNVDERDIHWVKQGAAGEASFIGSPEQAYAVAIRSINPAADIKKDRNSFIATAYPTDDQVQRWWRPGMTGVAKVDAGPQPVWWVLLHKTIDYLRLLLWW